MLTFLLIACGNQNAKDSAENTLLQNRKYAECFPLMTANFQVPYEEIETESLTETCAGTHRQDFDGIEHVVFLGDSVTVGTYPTLEDGFYRSILTQKLAEKYELELPEADWYTVDYDSGRSKIQRSGDFSSCAKLGAETDELTINTQQLATCITADLLKEKVLIVMTMGGNDLNMLTKKVIDGVSDDQLWPLAENVAGNMERALSWVAEQPFEKGVNLVFANIYEFTDATGDPSACPLSQVVNLDVQITNPVLEEMTLYLEREYLNAARKNGFDMLFLFENFCGHGFHHDNPDSRCYLGANAELWFDNTCLHPNPKGHQVLAEMFLSVIDAP